jgi:carboxymethylenebutenolidase
MTSAAQIAGLAVMLATLAGSALAQQPERVAFPSADGRTSLTGYLFRPAAPAARMPAVVLMHGRGGVY